jgi:signal recognition particle subunit SRP72
VDPTDKDALQTKLFLLLQTEGYEAALEFISSGQEASRYAFERAYSLYRLHMESEAREILDSLKALGGGNRGCLHLEAQLVSFTVP